jgi:DNA-binding XRE family transcriptional regulator
MPKVPDGWKLTVVPGWPTNQQWKSELERAGNVLLPQAFTAIVSAEDHSDVVFLCMVVDAGEVKMSAVMSSFSDVPAGLDRVRRAAPMHEWKRLAIAGMARWLAVVDPDDLARDFAQMATTGGNEWWVSATRAWQNQLAGTADTNMEHAVSMPIRRKRNRLTREHLERVAEVYRDAHAKGEAPTRAVQKHFGTTHSTAAKWVSLARKEGILGRARNTRGGEISAGDALRKAREYAQMTLGDIAKVTGISTYKLSALEEGDLSRLEWDPNISESTERRDRARQIVRTYAEALGLPIEPIMEQYEAERSERLGA